MAYVTLLPTMIIWWYKDGLLDLISFQEALFAYINNAFSPLLILKTLFAPWKKLVGEKRPGLDNLKEWLADNIISRGIGIFLRSILLIIYIAILFLYFVICATSFVLWAAFPLLIVFSFLYIFTGSKS